MNMISWINRFRFPQLKVVFMEEFIRTVCENMSRREADEFLASIIRFHIYDEKPNYFDETIIGNENTGLKRTLFELSLEYVGAFGKSMIEDGEDNEEDEEDEEGE